MEEVQKKEKFHHPKGLWLACIGMAGSSYLKYAVSGITIFFYTYSVAMGGLGLSDKQAGLIISIAGAFGSVLPLLGSIITDRFLGMQKAMIMAFFLQSVAYAIFFFFTPHVPMIIVGIVINMCSMAFMNNNLTAIVGMLYSNKEHARKDAAYGIFYMAVNIGSFFGPIFGGLLTDHWMAVKDAEGNIVKYGYKYAYLMVAIGMFIVFLIFLVLIPKWLGEVGKHPANAKGANKEEKQKVELKFSPVEKTRLVGMGIIFILVTVYWTVYFQTSYTINTLANDYVNLNVGGFHVPVVWLISFNGILCIILAPLLGNLWMTLSQKKLDPPVSLKMAVGMIITGLAFYIILIGFNTLHGVLDKTVKMDLWYMLVAYTVLTVGELLVSPVGMALFNKLTPERFSSLAMSVWYLTYTFSGIASGYLVAVTKVWGYGKILNILGAALLISGVVMLVIMPFIEKLIAVDKLSSEETATETAE